MFLANFAPFLFFSAFVLLLLVTLSAPIIDPIYLFRLSTSVGTTGASGKGGINFGVFGYCISDLSTTIVGIDKTSNGRCSKPRLGYTLDSNVSRVLGTSGITDVIGRVTTAVFILNPIATGLAFIAFFFSLFMLRKGANGTARLPSFLTFGVGVLAALAATAAFVGNIVIVAIVRRRIRDDAGGAVNMTWGNGVWMTLAAMVALWLALIGAMCGICGFGGHRRRRTTTTATY
ncbi:actin cortical patch SUR7/pH-response regulator pali [Ephemerocybe angulata]|uniref:Actin cortical patch SUR7/pH-response regulator pali n=1 Tax=Ephemerocybe angulata TaxID=980116 RepID=A0A8H6IIV3_9AGAR|nr:actin cortical patch SUR7/pH-response regulator pali [Tulosesus angulatus]